MELRYSILDPTGNITALVEDEVEIACQPAVAAEIMRRHPEAEQVGFLRPASEGGAAAELRMAGGEFCGNASMCAAALLLLRCGKREGRLHLRVSGAVDPVIVSLRQMTADQFEAALYMPPVLSFGEEAFAFGPLRGVLPVVCMQGITHLIIAPDSPFFALSEDHPTAEAAARTFCATLSAEGLGLLFLDGDGAERRMTPLVYVPGSGTLFWEKSCASGSAAVGMFLAKKSGTPFDLFLHQPGGTLRVSADPASGETRLIGGIKLVSAFSEKISERC